MIMRALISVSDKEGLVDFAKALTALNIEIISTGGTATTLENAGVRVKKISDVTEFPEMMDGRVKTLHPRIHGGLLALRDHPDHMAAAAAHGIDMIDLVAVNLYPFEATIKKDHVKLEEAIENIDIGGPSMIRSAAKNYRHVVVIVDPSDYTPVADELRTTGNVSEDTRYRLMIKAFQHTGYYDSVIARFFSQRLDSAPDRWSLPLVKAQSLRYGENPHQTAGFYTSVRRTFYRQLHGKELSYNNFLDLDACVRVVSDFDKPCCVIVKHTNPCGAAIHDNPYDAYVNARATDPVSAFGGVIGFNRPLTGKTAHDIRDVFVEAIIAPSFDPDALATLQQKKNIRLIAYDFDAARRESHILPEIKKALDGYLVQDSDELRSDAGAPDNWKVVSKRQPTEDERRAMIFGWRIVKHVKSNAIVYAAADRTLGIGAGQMSRVDSSELAAAKAAKSGLSLKGSAVASDAFFPFRDGIDAAAAAGATCVIQPGGSVKDADVIAAADAHGMAMIFTSVRHFRH